MDQTPNTPKQHVTNFNRLHRSQRISVVEYRNMYDLPKTTFYRWRKRYSPSALKSNKPPVKPSQKTKPSPKRKKA
jgi:hypothetical protein